MSRNFLYSSVLVIIGFTLVVELLDVWITGVFSLKDLSDWRKLLLLVDSPLAAGAATYMLGLIAEKRKQQRSTAEMTVRFGTNSSGSGPIEGVAQEKRVRIKEQTPITFKDVHKGKFEVIEVPTGYELRYWATLGEIPNRRGSGDDVQRWYSAEPANVDMTDAQYEIVIDEPPSRTQKRAAFGTVAQITFAGLLTVATFLLVWYNAGLLKATKESSDILRRDFELRNLSQIGVTNWNATVEGTALSYRFQIEEHVGAVTELRKVETYISPNQQLSPDGLYQCHDVDAGFELHRLGNRYTVSDQVNLQFRSDGTETEHAVYIYVRLTHRDIASEQDRYRLDARLIRFDNEGHIKQFPIVRPPESVIHQMFDQEQGGPC